MSLSQSLTSKLLKLNFSFLLICYTALTLECTCLDFYALFAELPSAHSCCSNHCVLSIWNECWCKIIQDSINWSYWQKVAEVTQNDQGNKTQVKFYDNGCEMMQIEKNHQTYILITYIKRILLSESSLLKKESILWTYNRKKLE